MSGIPTTGVAGSTADSSLYLCCTLLHDVDTTRLATRTWGTDW